MILRINGFQILRNVELEFKSGEIVIIRGDNNSGKSAIIRAIETIFTNYSSAKDFVNDDMKKAEIEIITDDGHTYKWIREKNSSIYIVDGRTYLKPNRDNLTLIDPDCRFLLEKTDVFSLIPHLVFQQEKIFPYNTTPSIVFKIFSSFMASPQISEVQADVAKLISDHNAELILIRRDINNYETEIENFKNDLLKLPNKKDLINLKDKILYYNSLIDKYNTKFIPLKESMRKILSMQDMYKSILSQYKFTNKINDNMIKYNRYIEYRNIIQDRLNEYNNLKSNLDEYVNEINRHKGILCILDNFKIEYNLEQYKLLNEVFSLVKSYDDLNNKLLELIKSERELKLKLDTFKRCPVCKKVM